MAVSKRLRYEILRRDNHAYRYCGAAAPDVKLNVDHVIPTSLGGSDKPDNLVTACADCNGAKTSSMPNAEPVADVDQDAFRQAAALASERAEEERFSTGVDAINAWENAWETASPDGPAVGNTVIPVIDHVTAALDAGHPRVDLVTAAMLAGAHLSTDLAYYLPKHTQVGGGN